MMCPAPLLVAVGGALGAVSRYALSSFIANRYKAQETLTRKVLPLGTMTVNIIGSFLIGFLTALIALIRWSLRFEPKSYVDAHATFLTLLLVTGFCGGFTTFSTAIVDAVELARQGYRRAAWTSVIVTLIPAFIALNLGLAAVRLFAP